MEYTIAAKNMIKRLASPALDLCGVYESLLTRRVFSQPSWVILMYHRIVDTSTPEPFQLGMCVRSDHFEEQVRYHMERFTPITLEDAAARIRNGRPLPRNAVSFTFDDGYKDFKTVALPILKKYRAPSTLYVTTGGLPEGRFFWWDRVVNAFHLTREKKIDIDFLSPDEGRRTVSLHPLQRRQSLLEVKRLLWRQSPERLESLVSELCDRLAVHDYGGLAARRLNPADITELGNQDVELAAHCHAHVDMRLLPPQGVTNELVTSRRILQEMSGQPVNGFAYPGGRQNSTVRQLVARAGFTYAAGTDRGINREPYETFNLRRIGMPNIGISDYKRCLIAAAGAARGGVEHASVTWP